MRVVATRAQAATVAEITRARDWKPAHGDVLRLYRAFFNREPDVSGAKYWLDLFDNGTSLDAIAEAFAAGQEFRNKYAGTSNGAFVDRVYRNVFDRTPDAGGRDYWVGLLNDGKVSRAGVVRWMSDSAEFRRNHPYPKP